MDKKAHIFWCTGMSGSGKSTLAHYAKVELEGSGLKVLILDGDDVRERYDVQLGFGREDIEKNNLYVVRLCKQERHNYDAIIVPIISPINDLRLAIKNQLSPNYHLIFINSDIDTLKKRDTKGLYKMSDEGQIKDLIGYSSINPYDAPNDYNLLVHTGKDSNIIESKKIFLSYLSSKIFKSSFEL